jgi:hypothetical protein
MAPISSETLTITSQVPKHFGPVVPEISSVWFRLFLYHAAGAGPESMLFPKGHRVRLLPDLFADCETVTVQTWEHDPTVVPVSNLLPALNDWLQTSPVLVQANTYYTGAPPPQSGTGSVSTTAGPKPGIINLPFPIETTLVEYASSESSFYFLLLAVLGSFAHILFRRGVY